MSKAHATVLDTEYRDNLVYMPSRQDEVESVEPKSAVEEIYETSYRVAFRLLGHREAAEDAAVETVARVLEQDLGAADFACSYAARTAAHVVISSWRKDATARKYAHIVTPQEVVSDQDKDIALLRLDLRRALAKLTRRQRDVIVLRYIADLPEATVSEFLNCSLGMVKSTTHDALARLKNMVEVKP